MQGIFEYIHWLHVFLLIVLGLYNIWAWRKRHFWLPLYVHALALVAFALGIAATASLPAPTTRNTFLQFIWPAIFPSIFTAVTYLVFVIVGGVEAASDSRHHPRDTL